MVTVSSVLQWMAANRTTLIEQAIQHLNIALTALFISIVLWVSVGALVQRYDRLSDPVLGTAGVILTIPSLALLSLLIPIVGIGVPAAVIALVLYSALPIARNTYVGLRDVAEASVEAGRGLGMTDRQLLFKVRLPLALSVIMAGIRQAAVLLIAITTVAAFFGAGGLGKSIFAGIRLGNSEQILGAALGISLLAVAIDSGLYGVQRLLPGSQEVSI